MNEKKEKNTRELEAILQTTHPRQVGTVLEANAESMVDGENAFSRYVKETIRDKHMRQVQVFVGAEIPERYGYKLLSGEKHTGRRDVILRICAAAHFTLEETKRALELYGMPVFYAKRKRDALLMVAFNEAFDSVERINGFLLENGCEPLEACGVQEEADASLQESSGQ